MLDHRLGQPTGTGIGRRHAHLDVDPYQPVDLKRIRKETEESTGIRDADDRRNACASWRESDEEVDAFQGRDKGHQTEINEEARP